MHQPMMRHPSTPLAQVQTSLRVLVVDDLPFTRRCLRALLEDEGMLVTEASSGEDALRTVARQQPDIVVTDLNMPGLDGIETAEILQARHGSTVVLHTGAADHAVVSRATRAGLAGVVQKGCVEDLLGTIERLASCTASDARDRH